MSALKYKRVEKAPLVTDRVFVKVGENMIGGEVVESLGEYVAVKLDTSLVDDFMLYNVYVIDDSGRLPTKSENPDGYHQRYKVEKLDGSVDPMAEYFILRLDDGAEPKHRAACIQAVLTYAREMFPYNEKMAQEIIDRYANLQA